MKKALILAILLPGCAINRPYMRETTTTTGTNGVTTTTERLSKATTVGLWPGSAEVGKQRTSLGKTMSIGQQDVTTEGGGTNVIEGLREFRKLAESLK